MASQTENGIMDDEIHHNDQHQREVQVQGIDNNVICVATDNQPPSIIHHQEEVSHEASSQNSVGDCSQGHPVGITNPSVVVASANNAGVNSPSSINGTLTTQQTVSGGVTIPVNVQCPVISESDLGANVTTASIITIPVVPYTVIGDADGGGATTAAISVSLADSEAIAHHQLPATHSAHQITQQLQNELQQHQASSLHADITHQQQLQNELHNQQIRNEIQNMTAELQHQGKDGVSQQLSGLHSKSTGASNQSQGSSSSNSSIQSNTTGSSTGSGKPHSQMLNHLTWEEAVSAEVLPVRCKDTNAELYKSRFGSGNKGKCIKAAEEWFTPTEFEALCGRGNSKDWKRSIRFGGRTLQTLIDKGFLTPHASSCICSNCVDDSSATGPIRPFTPYHRKRKSQAGNQAVANANSITQALMKLNYSPPATTEEGWKNLEDLVEKLISAAMLMKTMINEMKERSNQELEAVKTQLQEQQQLQSFELAQQQQPQGQQTQIIETPQTQIIRIFDSNRIQYAIEVLDPQTFNKQFQASQSNSNSSKVTESYDIICQETRNDIKEEPEDVAQPMT